jgi:signal transduction histidine kinase
MAPVRPAARLALLSAAVAAGLVAIAAFDLVATRRELLSLLRDQASSVRGTVAAAARSNREAARLVEGQLQARLLDNARLLRELDTHGGLGDARLDAVARQHGLFRVSVFGADGELVRRGGAAAGRPGGRGAGQGPGPGAGPAGLLPRLLGGEDEIVTGLHTPRSGEGARLAAGVRRRSGGALILNVDAAEVAALLRQGTLEALLADIVASAPDVSFVAFEQAGRRFAHGDPAPEPGLRASGERVVTAGGRPVLELTSQLALGAGVEPAALRLGMRLDGVRRAERRMLAQLGFTLLASTALAGLGVGVAWLRRRYALLSDEHTRAQQALRRRDRLAAMGELASQVAHEVRNPLNAIAMSGQRLRREFLPAVPEAHEDRQGLQALLDVVAGETQRIDAIVQRFLEYARPPRIAPRPVHLGALVLETLQPFQPRFEAKGVRLDADTAGAATALLDPERIRQALENVLRNALDATPAGGHVRVEARSNPSGHVVLVSDSGAGIGADDLPRVFDLYFTTKPDGTGVGLAVTQQILSAHGGTVDVESAPGRGTRLALRLPHAPPGS